jgi:hypothetical protein
LQVGCLARPNATGKMFTLGLQISERRYQLRRMCLRSVVSRDPDTGHINAGTFRATRRA